MSLSNESIKKISDNLKNKEWFTFIGINSDVEKILCEYQGEKIELPYYYKSSINNLLMLINYKGDLIIQKPLEKWDFKIMQPLNKKPFEFDIIIENKINQGTDDKTEFNPTLDDDLPSIFNTAIREQERERQKHEKIREMNEIKRKSQEIERELEFNKIKDKIQNTDWQPSVKPSEGSDKPIISNKNPIYYGFIPNEVSGNIRFSMINMKMLENKSSHITKTQSIPNGKISNGVIPTGSLLVVLIPESLNNVRAFKDNGGGSKVSFNTSINGENGLDMILNGIKYKVYGELMLVNSEVLIYIE